MNAVLLLSAVTLLSHRKPLKLDQYFITSIIHVLAAVSTLSTLRQHCWNEKRNRKWVAMASTLIEHTHNINSFKLQKCTCGNTKVHVGMSANLRKRNLKSIVSRLSQQIIFWQIRKMPTAKPIYMQSTKKRWCLPL